MQLIPRIYSYYFLLRCSILYNILFSFSAFCIQIVYTHKALHPKKNHLAHKNSELDKIVKETEKEEKTLLKKAEEFSENIEPRLLKAYTKIRSAVKNGLAVVPVERGASAGSYFTIPPQRQMEIALRKKIITDEHSGRILVDAELAAEERLKMEDLLK